MKESSVILSELLDEEIRKRLKDESQVKLSPHNFLKRIIDVVCDGLPLDIYQNHDKFHTSCTKSFAISKLASQIPALLELQALLDTSLCCLKELKKARKFSKASRVCVIVTEIIKCCPFEWLIGANIQDLQNYQIEERKTIMKEYLESLLKLVDLMPVSFDEIKNDENQILFLYPSVIQLCHMILRRTSKISDDVSIRNFGTSLLKSIACNIAMTCIQQTGQCFWIKDDCAKVARKVLKSLMLDCSCSSISSFLCGSENLDDNCAFPKGIFGSILQSLKDFMANAKLPDYPVAIHVLVWTVQNVKHPYFSEHISMVLPPLMMLVHDYRVPNCIIGIQTLSHLISNMNARELCWYGRAGIIYDALHHRLYTNEAQVMTVLQPCLLHIIKVIEQQPKTNVTHFQMTRCDENFQIILSAMEFENKILMRRAYCSNLAMFVNYLGVNVAKHLKRLMRVIYSYLDIGDGDTEEWRICILGVLKSVIVSAWARIPFHTGDILRALMRLLIDISMSSQANADVKDIMYEQIQECLSLLLRICGEPLRRELECMTSDIGMKKVETLICSVLCLHKSQNF